jgi:hypothetical protein
MVLCGCTEEHGSLRTILGRVGNTLSITPTRREVVFSLLREDEGGKCPVLSKEVELTVDGKSPEYFDRGGNLGGAFSRKCQRVTGAVIELASLERGEERVLLLTEGTQQVTVVLRLASLESDVLTPAPFPGPGKPWRFEWRGGTPVEALLQPGAVEAGRRSLSGGFEVEVPADFKAPLTEAHLFFTPWVLERCEGATCKSTSIELKKVPPSPPPAE